jgi:hypothetical protein
MLRRVAQWAVFAGAIASARDAPAPIRVAPEPAAPQPVAVEILRADVREGRLEVEARVVSDSGQPLADLADEPLRLAVDGRPLLDATGVPTASGGFVFGVPVTSDGGEHAIRVARGDLEAVTRVRYPAAPAPFLPWIAGAGGVAALALSAGVVLARRRGRAGLAVVSGPEAGRRLVLRRGRTRIGSLEQNDLVLTSPTVSRYHAEILLGAGGAELRDLHSLNGTQVNGRRVEVARLAPGDKLRIGDVDLFFEG